MKIRSLQVSDYDDLFQLYRHQTSGLPYHHNVRRDQFRRDLLTTRFLRNPANHHPKAKIALVGIHNDRVCAFVSGGLVKKGDEVIESGTGYVQAIIGEPSTAETVRELVHRVVKHLRRFRPKKILAQDGCLSPVFFSDSASTLPSQSAWIGQVLLDCDFEIRDRCIRLVAPLDGVRRKAKPPDDLEFLHLTHEMHGFDPKFDFGCLLLKPPYGHGDGVVWSGNFYSGVFVQGTAYRSLFMNWFTIIDPEYRGRGLGRLMLRHCLHEAQSRGAKYASLLTSDDNFVALNLYQSEGFELADVTHSFQYKQNR